MSLTSYRAAPPRGRSEIRGRRSDPGEGGFEPPGGKRVVMGEGRGRRSEDAGGGRASGVFCSLLSALWSGTPRPTWRRPALPPLGGQYPGRGAVSRPSSEWGRVGPARCDHQVERGVQDQRTEIRGQRSEDAGGDPGAEHPGLTLSREALGKGSEVRCRRAEVRRRSRPLGRGRPVF